MSVMLSERQQGHQQVVLLAGNRYENRSIEEQVHLSESVNIFLMEVLFSIAIKSTVELP